MGLVLIGALSRSKLINYVYIVLIYICAKPTWEKYMYSLHSLYILKAYTATTMMGLNLHALIFHRNNKKERRCSANRHTCFWVSQSMAHSSNIRKLKANFCERENEGHFHFKNFLRALKRGHTHSIATKYFSLIGSQNIVANQSRDFVVYHIGISCGYSF